MDSYPSISRWIISMFVLSLSLAVNSSKLDSGATSTNNTTISQNSHCTDFQRLSSQIDIRNCSVITKRGVRTPPRALDIVTNVTIIKRVVDEEWRIYTRWTWDQGETLIKEKNIFSHFALLSTNICKYSKYQHRRYKVWRFYALAIHTCSLWGTQRISRL